MSKLSVTPDFVTFTQPGYLTKFNRLWGGAPLEMYETSGAHPISVIAQPSGLGCQIFFDNGQDGTQASATGLDSNPVSGADSYYTHEEAIVFDAPGREALYQVGGAIPYFWISFDPEDDCIPPDPRGDNRWSTRYHDILNKGIAGYEIPGCPVFAAGTAQVSSGMLMLGDEIVKTYSPSSPWQNEMAKIPNGNVAIKTTISLLHANADAVAGIVFGKYAPLGTNPDINSLYSAPGYMLLVNKSGGVALHENNAVISVPISPAAAKMVNTEDGLQLEVRTIDSTVLEIWVAGVKVLTHARILFGPFAGLFWSAASGVIKFHRRYFFDMGTRICAQYRTTPRNTVIQNLTVYRAMEPFVSPFYRTNLPVAYVDPVVQGVCAAYDAQGHKIASGGVLNLSQFAALYAGRADGSAGVFCKLIGWQGSPNAHAGLAVNVLALNSQSYNSNFAPESGQNFSVITEWAPKLRLDLLK